MADYFQLLGLPRSFDVDMTLLNQNYFKLQQEFHPDKNKDGAARSAELNQAYNTLKNRLLRAEYLAGGNLEASPALLMEVMELRESGDVQQARNDVEELYKKFSAAGEKDRKDIFVRIKYLSKFIEDSK